MSDLCWRPVNGRRCELQAGHLVPCSDDPDGGWVTVPTTPFTEIVERLWQGGSYHYDPAELANFDAVLTLNGRPVPAPASVRERRFYIQDGDVLPDIEALHDHVLWAYGQWTAGHSVLVRCQAGLNRSGLVVALVLYRDGWAMDDIIERIRERRSPYALCNPFFVEYLQQLA